jgi:regulatory protein
VNLCYPWRTMRSRSPRKLSTEEQLYAAAMRALARRAHSVHDMRAMLERRAEEKSLVRPVLDRLKQHKYLDDARYAREFSRAHAQSRRQGRFRIARELRARGLPDRHIEAALDEAFSETDEVTLVRARLRQKLARFGGGAKDLDQRKLASLYRSLLRAGFSADMIRNQLRALAEQDVEPPGEIVSPEEQ